MAKVIGWETEESGFDFWWGQQIGFRVIIDSNSFGIDHDSSFPIRYALLASEQEFRWLAVPESDLLTPIDSKDEGLTRGLANLL